MVLWSGCFPPQSPCKRHQTSLWSTWRFATSWWWSRHPYSSTTPLIAASPAELSGKSNGFLFPYFTVSWQVVVVRQLPSVCLHWKFVWNWGRDDKRVHRLRPLQCHHPAVRGQIDSHEGPLHHLTNLGLHDSLGRSAAPWGLGSICTRWVSGKLNYLRLRAEFLFIYFCIRTMRPAIS